ncbi:MAG TPA: hypothetical protein VK841_10445 [Polyangiaceae bacterium]|nr:hypothetical protein [Polyangiaceae bacterium]
MSGVVSGSTGSGSTGTGSLGGTNSGSTVLGQQTLDATAEACQQFSLQFTPRIPLVYVLVDSSGSMFDPSTQPDGGQSDEWVPLRTATLNVIQSLQSTVDFGFGDYGSNGSASTYTAADYSAHMCGLLNNVPIAPNNYSAIDTLYTSLGDMQPYQKTNTPATIALGQAATYLKQAAAAVTDGGTTMAGGMYVLWVTDGETDFCDDGSPLCPADAVTGEVQTLYNEGITTFVLGLPSDLSSISPQVLQGLANAGVGMPALAPPSNPGQPPASPLTISQQCSGEGGWQAIVTAENIPAGQSIGTYSTATTVANAPLFSPSSIDEASLETAIATALKTVKSCSFDLQGQIMVDLTMAYLGTVSIDGTPLSYVASADAGGDGWTMSTPTELDLVGAACTTWQTSGMSIAGSFPCQVIHPIPPR